MYLSRLIRCIDRREVIRSIGARYCLVVHSTVISAHSLKNNGKTSGGLPRGSYDFMYEQTARHNNIDNTSTFMSVLCNLTKERIDYKLLSFSILPSIFLIPLTEQHFRYNRVIIFIYYNSIYSIIQNKIES